MTNEKIDPKKMEQHLLKTQFPLEAKQIPLESLNTKERKVVTKCIDGEELTDKEFTLLKKTLQKYREAINKYKPAETVEAFEKTQNLIFTEQDWLDIVDDRTNRLLKVNVPYNGKWYPMEFEVLPLDDSRVVETLQTHVDLFKDYKPSEIKTFTKAQEGQVLTPEEQAIVAKMTKDMESRASEDHIRTMNHFLASQMRLPKSDSSIEKRLEFWKKFPFMTKSAIMMKVEDRLGLTERSNQELFPDG